MARALGSVGKKSNAGKFIVFVINKISKAKGTKRNLIMSRLIDEFCKKYNIKSTSLSNYPTAIRVILEQAGYIMYSPLNSMDRRVKYLSPTSKFPRPHQRKKLEKLARMVHKNCSRLIHNRGLTLSLDM